MQNSDFSTTTLSEELNAIAPANAEIQSYEASR